MNRLKIEKVLITGVNHNTFRCGETAEVVGTVYVTPENHERRLCFVIRFEDGYEDYVPICDAEKPPLYRLEPKIKTPLEIAMDMENDVEN